MRGTVVAVHGHHFLVEGGEGGQCGIVECVTRGKKGGVACGDNVKFAFTSAGRGVIESIAARRNLLYRSDEFRSKLLAANVDQAAIIVAAVPAFHEELLIRCLVACEVADIPALIVLNKADLPETEALARGLAPYIDLGYPLLQVSAREEVAALAQRLAGHTTVLVGASGVGKSTLLNRLVPDANATTGEISLALDAGKHTTTHARLFRLPSGAGALIDSPGMQEFGLKHLDQASLMAAFPEIRSRHGQCRFYNCRHLKEPGCAVLEAAKTGSILASRLKVYHGLLAGIR
ncbi:MAG: ribosome small subunit-dependent GTPase A [Hydrogenophilales bacterium CG17_big_fil_post_rev_8_21_14_2_50_63_12]|nr:MAG: ribosome small subunit-dependent GTPase A [Hydrogenophilales bacterium CG17_big_fil_post_rev_8_21_14_2_50_63_12]